MIADAALRLIVSEPKMLFTTGCSLPGVLPFSVCFLFFIYKICFPFFLRIVFLLEADCCLSQTAAATCCETNSLEYGRKFPIAKARLLTFTRTWKWKKKEKKMKIADNSVYFLCLISMCKVWPAWVCFGKIWTCQPGPWTCLPNTLGIISTATGVRACDNVHPWSRKITKNNEVQRKSLMTKSEGCFILTMTWLSRKRKRMP